MVFASSKRQLTDNDYLGPEAAARFPEVAGRNARLTG
jgi:hypothetical protein